MNSTNWPQILSTAVTVALFIGGLVTGYVHLVLKSVKEEIKGNLIEVKSEVKTDILEVKDEILKTVKSEFQQSNLARQTELEIRRRLRQLERKNGIEPDSNDDT